MDAISSVSNDQEGVLWDLLFSKDSSKTGGANCMCKGEQMQGMDNQNQYGMTQLNGNSPQNGTSYNNSGIVININFNFNFVNALA